MLLVVTFCFQWKVAFFCDNSIIKVKGCKQKLPKFVAKCTEESIELATIEQSDKWMLCKVHDQDLIAREAIYHNACREIIQDLGHAMKVINVQKQSFINPCTPKLWSS